MIQADLTITHSPAEGPMIDGTSKGDGSAAVLKAQGWRWSRNLGAWYVARSRDTRPDMDKIGETVAALEGIGFAVAVEIDETRRGVAEGEADRIARAEERARHLAERARRSEERAQQAYATAHELSDRMPLGQPILTDHYSAPAMRRAYDKISRAQDKAVEGMRRADDDEQRATAAAAATGARYNPTTVGNRIDRIGAEIRDRERRLAGYSNHLGDHFPPATGTYRARMTEDLETLRDELEHWQDVRAEQISQGKATSYSRDDISAGDAVSLRGNLWWQVKRVNPTTVTLMSDGCSTRAPYHAITGHRPKK